MAFLTLCWKSLLVFYDGNVGTLEQVIVLHECRTLAEHWQNISTLSKQVNREVVDVWFNFSHLFRKQNLEFIPSGHITAIQNLECPKKLKIHARTQHCCQVDLYFGITVPWDLFWVRPKLGPYFDISISMNLNLGSNWDLELWTLLMLANFLRTNQRCKYRSIKETNQKITKYWPNFIQRTTN